MKQYHITYVSKNGINSYPSQQSYQCRDKIYQFDLFDILIAYSSQLEHLLRKHLNKNVEKMNIMPESEEIPAYKNPYTQG